MKNKFRIILKSIAPAQRKVAAKQMRALSLSQADLDDIYTFVVSSQEHKELLSRYTSPKMSSDEFIWLGFS